MIRSHLTRCATTIGWRLHGTAWPDYIAPVANDRGFTLTSSRGLPSWLAANKLSIAFTTYQAGKLFMIGTTDQGRLAAFERTFERAMGLSVKNDTIWMSSKYQLWRIENALDPGISHDGYDRVYIPRIGYTTGDLDMHDVGIDADGHPVFVATSFSCIATISQTRSFKPLWKPAFISKLVPEDRCHLNGMAMRDGKPVFVTAVSTTDVSAGWREHRDSGGVVVDVESNEVITAGLSMPHSPRWHNGKLWLLNAGTGEFGFITPDTCEFVPVTFCPGFLRGMAFHGNYAIVAMSGPRDERLFNGLPLEDRLTKEQISGRCGIQIIDLNTGSVVQWIELSGVISELYDVAVLPGVQRPMLVGFKTPEIEHLLSIEGTLNGVEGVG